MTGLFNICIEVLTLVTLSIWYSFETIFRWLIPPKRKDISGMTAVVTGAGHGIGRCIALALAKKGVKVVLLDINESNIKNVAQEINEQNGIGFPFQCDVTEKEKVYEIAKRIQQEVGNVDILVNNAGVVNGLKLLDCSDDEIIKTINVNVMAHFWTIKAFLSPMKERNQGHIVAISSVMGLIGSTHLVDYCSSKSAVITLMEALQQETMWELKDGVFFTTVMPSKVDTGLFNGSKGRFSFFPPSLQPEYVAGKVVDAIQRNEYFVILPPWLSFVLALKRLLPQKVIHECLTFFGIEKSMDMFKGHKKTV